MARRNNWSRMRPTRGVCVMRLAEYCDDVIAKALLAMVEDPSRREYYDAMGPPEFTGSPRTVAQYFTSTPFMEKVIGDKPVVDKFIMDMSCLPSSWCDPEEWLMSKV